MPGPQNTREMIIKAKKRRLHETIKLKRKRRQLESELETPDYIKEVRFCDIFLMDSN
jgi:hypothetical protein